MIPQWIIDEIKRSEGFDTGTWDYKQYSTGYGTRARYPGERLSPEEANARLSSELMPQWEKIQAFAPSAPEGVRGALLSLSHNAGPGWMQAGLGKALAAGDMDTARQRFLQYTKAGGQDLPALVDRRQREASWWGGAPSGSAVASAPAKKSDTPYAAAAAPGRTGSTQTDNNAPFAVALPALDELDEPTPVAVTAAQAPRSAPVSVDPYSMFGLNRRRSPFARIA